MHQMPSVMDWFEILCLKQLVLDTCCFVVVWIVLPLGNLCWLAVGRESAAPVPVLASVPWRWGVACLYAGSLASEAVQLHLYRNGGHAMVMLGEEAGWPQSHLSKELHMPETRFWNIPREWLHMLSWGARPYKKRKPGHHMPGGSSTSGGEQQWTLLHQDEHRQKNNDSSKDGDIFLPHYFSSFLFPSIFCFPIP